MSHSSLKSIGLGKFYRTALRGLQGLLAGVMLQASGCSFDTDAFVSQSLSALYNNISTLLVITTVSDLFGVPAFSGF